MCNVWVYLLDSSGLDNEKHNSRKQNRDKMELHVKTRGPGLCRRHSTHVIMLHTHANKDKTTKSICRKDRTKINKKKTQVLRINSKCENRILINDQELKEVDKYNYLGANVSKQGGGGDDIVSRIRKARVSFMKLKQKWLSNIYTLRFKLRLFNKLVKPVLLYGSETWKINEGDNKKLDTFFKCLRRILQIRWPYVVSNRDILSKTKLKTISIEVKLRSWKWVGHILRSTVEN